MDIKNNWCGSPYHCACGSKVVELAAQVKTLREELARYRPMPLAKFRINQVLAPLDCHFVIKVSGVHHNGVQWMYYDTCNRLWGESNLRALNTEERGESADASSAG